MGCSSGKGASDAAAKVTPQVTICRPAGLPEPNGKVQMAKEGEKEYPTFAFKSSADVKEFPEFPADCKSTLKKCLTKEVWEKCKGTHDNTGFTFEQAIYSGLQNIDSGIGCYAGSADSYSKFAPLFDGVIQDYHGHKPSDKHVSDMTLDNVNIGTFSEEEKAMIVSTRIRVGRNLAEVPLGPNLTNEQRKIVMDKVVEACGKFEGDLKGKFYPLDGMKKEDQDQLIADHFLFKEGDRYLEACNLNRDWPKNRGIFHNEAKNFLVWVNEEDQLRIISMQKDDNIQQVFKRLCTASAAIEKVAKFAHNDHLGYITSCPTNLGTALRASVHIKLPKLSQDKTQFQAIADKFNVQIRGIHGEHSESDDGTYDISNKRRLGISEAKLVEDMYNGVKEMMKAELAL